MGQKQYKPDSQFSVSCCYWGAHFLAIFAPLQPLQQQTILDPVQVALVAMVV